VEAGVPELGHQEPGEAAGGAPTLPGYGELAAPAPRFVLGQVVLGAAGVVAVPKLGVPKRGA